MRILGIDLGTTNSLIAYYDESGARIIPNRLGQNLTPSVVSISDEGEVYVGQIAKERMVSHPGQSVAAFKRNMGSAKSFRLGGKNLLPEELSSLILRSLLEDAEAFLGEPPEEVVISVPAYFNDIQRKATQRAAELAGIRAERLINEPTAASIAYGMQEEAGHTKYLVLDLGGGTFDVSILEFFSSIMEVRSVAGDNYLGGEDFTDIMAEIYLKKLSGVKLELLSLRELAMIHKQAEEAKIKIGSEPSVEITCTLQGKEHSCTVTQAEYETACKPLLARIRKPIERALTDASVKLEEIDNVVLVGGATKMPMVKRFVSKLFRKFPASHLNPDEVVAMGAAMQAAMKARDEQIREIILTDVCPYTLGTNISVPRGNGTYESGHYLPIIERNTIIPVSKTERLYTLHDQQTIIHVEILQGESRYARNNIKLGELNLRVPAGPRGQEAVDVRYTYDINSILEVEVTVVSTGESKRVVIEQNAGYMSQEEIDKRLKELEMLKIHPRDQEENKLLISRAERLYEESLGENRRYIESCLEKFEQALARQDAAEIRIAADLFKEQLAMVEEEGK